MMGETCVIAILLGLAYLLFTHTIEFTIPASIVGTMYVLTCLLYTSNCGRIGTLNVPTTAQQLAETCSRMLHTHCKFVEADQMCIRDRGWLYPGFAGRGAAAGG